MHQCTLYNPKYGKLILMFCKNVLLLVFSVKKHYIE